MHGCGGDSPVEAAYAAANARLPLSHSSSEQDLQRRGGRGWRDGHRDVETEVEVDKWVGGRLVRSLHLERVTWRQDRVCSRTS